MTPSHVLVTADWLAEHLHDSQIAIADCRFSLADPDLGRQQYLTSHIPGAYYLDLNRDLSSPVKPHGGRHPFPESQQLVKTLAAMGIKSGTTDAASLVVAYDDSKFAFAARLWWLLRYLGHDRVVVLDGGWSGWQAAGHPVTDQLPSPRSGNFVTQLQHDRIVNIDTVKAHKDLPEVALVDSRDRDRYLGEREPIDPIAGHIPGAVNYPWKGVSDAQGYLLPASEQAKRWATLDSPDEILVYCGSGVTACVNLLSLELAGIQTGKLYAGSWSDWISYL